MSETLDEKLARIGDEAYENRDAPIPEGTKITRGHVRSKTLQVRLNEDEYAAVSELADERGIPASTLARSILLDTVNSDSTVDGLLARIEHEVTQVRRKIHA